MAGKNNNLISLVEIQKAVDSGDLSLRKIRMEQLPDDLSEFSQTVEEHGLHIPKPFEYDLKWWLEKSATEADQRRRSGGLLPSGPGQCLRKCHSQCFGTDGARHSR